MPVLHRGAALALGSATILVAIAAVGREPQPAPARVDIERTESTAPTRETAAPNESPPVASTPVARVIAAAGVLTLSVDDAATGRPIAGAEVRLLGMRRQTLERHRTDATGSLRMDRPGGWGGRMLITRPGYRPRAWSDVERERRLSLEPIDTITVEVDGLPDHLLRRAQIRVQIDYGHLRVMAGSAEMRSTYDWYRSSSLAQSVAVVDGRARLSRAFAQRAQVEVFAEHPPSGWRQQLACRDVLPDQRHLSIVVGEQALRDTHFAFVRLNVPERVRAQELTLHCDGAVNGRLRRSSAEEPFTGWASGLAPRTYEFVACMIPPGTVEFHLGAARIEGVTEIFRQIDDNQLRVRVIGLRSAGLSLAVIDAATRRAPAYQEERLAPDEFRLSGLAPGRYELRGTARDCVVLPAFVDVTAGQETQDVALHVFRSAALTVIVPGDAGGATLRIVDLETACVLDLPELRRPIAPGVSETVVNLPRGTYGVELTVGARVLRRDVRIEASRATVDFR